MKILVAAVLFGLVATNTAVSSDLFNRNPNDLTIYSETTLSGVDFTTNVKQVIERLGKPDRVKTNYLKYSESEPPVRSYSTYEWQTTNWRLRITTHWDSKISQVDVWGTQADAGIGSTGRGLKLGDTIADAQRIYRLSLYSETSFPEANRQNWAPHIARSASIGSFPAGNSVLEIQFDSNSRVSHLRFRPLWGEY